MCAMYVCGRMESLIDEQRTMDRDREEARVDGINIGVLKRDDVNNRKKCTRSCV